MEAGCDIATKPEARPEWTGHGFRAQAGWFGPEDRPRFGWLYHPDEPGSLGIVIVPPFGHDDICAHRTLRHLAETSARNGFTTLRFDPDGCGDSAGDDSDPVRVESWIASVLDACELVRGTGASRVLLVGLRLGATLAALAAQRRDDVAALAAFNAVIRGKAWLRELRAFQAAMNLQPSPEDAAADGQEAGGFLLSLETCETLKTIDLTRVGPPARCVLILERDDLPGKDDWRRHLQGLGCDVVQRCIPGYVDMMADPHVGRVAQAFIDACIEFARGLPAPAKVPPEAPKPPLRASMLLRACGGGIGEKVVSPGAGIFGILAEPAHSPADRALLVLNAGAIRHIGANRFDVDFSRRLAAQGLCVLRVDLTGLGDSPARPGATENVSFGPHCIEDVGVCVAWLRARGVRELTVGGLCSGASHALGAVLAGQPIDAACLVNCAAFAPRAGYDPGADHRFHDIAHYNKSVKSARSWKKLLSGKVDLRRIARVAAWKIVLRGKHTVREVARRTGIPMRHDLARRFAALARRGVRVHFLYSADDPGRVRLAIEAGSHVSRLCRSGDFSMRIFAGANHIFTQRWAQASLRLALLQILLPDTGAVSPRAPEPPPDPAAIDPAQLAPRTDLG
jgi:pimeloyl-ACP methyl ester carboxylesterase